MAGGREQLLQLCCGWRGRLKGSCYNYAVAGGGGRLKGSCYNYAVAGGGMVITAYINKETEEKQLQ